MIYIIKYFRCPNGDKVEVKDCLAGCDHPCLTLPTRIFASRTRKWDGKTFSTTQLLQPTLLSFLKLTQPETVAPMDTLQAGLGTAGHALLEGCIPQDYIGEFRMLNDKGTISGQPDLIDLKNHILYDYKFVAAFSLAMMLGYERKGYWYEFKRGARKGQKEWRYRYEMGGTPDYHNYDWQQNCYRLLLAEKGIRIDKMVLQVTAKESDATCKQLGLDKRTYLIELPKYDDDVVRKKFDDAYSKLKAALDTNTIPEKCDDTWDGRRCAGWCSVNEFCPYYKGAGK